MNLDKFTHIPAPLMGLLVFVGGGSVVGLLAAFDTRLAMIAVAGITITTLLLLGYRRIIAWRQKKQASSMSGQIEQHSTSAPVGISEPAKRARLDDMKRNFEIGLDKFRAAGKDVYRLPWYLITGEPGSGKTEAVRHCNVGFPPGLQDELQGVGGTINMNWWFTNHAVMLDTAGRLMFEEVRPGETSEWREFLQLLKRNRPACPVNGLFLVIPAESLIRDTSEAIAKKAGKIAQQLDLIQRTLDVRFPVFILVTKCDLLNGFREFFEDLDDPQMQHQMLGWSNPEPRDAPFKPELVTQHLDTVVERVRKRRLGLLRDPSPRAENGKRADEVDALYGLPQSLALIGPRLRAYLETVFVAGEWSSKPLFLRGIYFTSAMREGSALDQELAEAVGIPLDELPEGRAWERERAYFLKDLFMEKAFRERGLVTRATNTKALLRKRQFILYGCGLGALALLLGLSYFGYHALKDSVGQQSRYWVKGRENWNAGVWRPMVERDARGATLYKGDAQPFADEKISLVDYHAKVRELATQDIKISWVFRPLARFAGLTSDRTKAQRVLFEGSVVGPVAREARRVMVEDRKPDPTRTIPTNTRMIRDAEAIAALIRIESDAIAPNAKVETLPDEVVTPLLRYATGQEKVGDEKGQRTLSELFVWTYSKNTNGVWPPPWLAAGQSLAANKPIQIGLDRLLRDLMENIKTQESGLAELGRLREQLILFRNKEADLNTTAIAPGNRAEVYQQMGTKFTELKAIKEGLDRVLREVEARNLLAGKRLTLTDAYQLLISRGQNQSTAAFDVLEKSVAEYAAKPNDAINSAHPLFLEVAEKLKATRVEIATRMAGGLTDAQREELPKLDKYLEDFGGGKRIYEVRWTANELAYVQLFSRDDSASLIGQNWFQLGQIMDDIVAQRTSITDLKTRLDEPFSVAPLYFLSRAEEIRLAKTVQRYLEQSRTAFEQSFYFPLVRTSGSRMMSKKERSDAEQWLAKWRLDLTSENFRRIQSLLKPKLESFRRDVEAIAAIVPTLDGNVGVGLVSYQESPDKQGLNHFRKVIVNGREFDTSEERFSANYGFFDTFNANFIDYSVQPRKATPFDIKILDLIGKVKSGGGRVAVTVKSFSVWLEVTPDRAPPDLSALPDKQAVLSNLN